jgi:hypothetical protein
MTAMPRVTSRRVLFGSIAALYLLAFPYHPGLRSPNELCRLWQTRALVEYGTLDINRALRDYGYVGDLSFKDGRYFPSKAPLLSFAAVPIYLVLKAWGGGGRYAVPEIPLVFWSRFFITVLPTLVMLVYVRRFVRTYLSDAWADVLTATYAVGSLAFGYSLLFISHQPTAVLLFGCFYALWRGVRGEWNAAAYAAAGAFAGAAIACEYTSVLTLLPLVVYAVLELFASISPWKPRLTALARSLGLATIGAAPFVIALMLYHEACFGSSFETGYKYLNDPGYQGWHVGGFLGIGLPDARAFVLSFFSPLRGLFSLSPFLLLAIPGLVFIWRSAKSNASLRGLFWLSSLELLVHAYFTSSFSYESWGWATGPRHMTPLVPYLLLPAGWFLQELSSRLSGAARFGLAVAIGLCITSIAMTGPVALVDYIPDSLSTAFFGLVWPLYRDGYLPPTVLAFVGIPNPWSGAVALLLLGLIALLTFVRALHAGASQSDAAHAPRRQGALAWVTAIVVMVHFGLMRAATRGDAADLGAQRHLRAVWLVPPGKTAVFWPWA